MKKAFIFILCVLIGCTRHASVSYPQSLIYVLEQLRHSTSPVSEVGADGKVQTSFPFVGGPEVGMAGKPGEFFLLIPYFEKKASNADLSRMLQDENPVVRVMAAYVIVKHGEKTSGLNVSSLAGDTAKIDVARGGCVIESTTVGSVVAQFRANPHYFNE